MKEYTLKEYIAHLLVGTPLQQPAQSLREVMNVRKRWKHPELQEIYMESSRINKMMERMIQDSMNCIDVGCHIGSMLNIMLQLSPHGNHIAIEPIPYKAEWLRRKFPGVFVQQIALSDTPHEATFHYYPLKSGFSGLRRRPQMTDDNSFQVRCERLDDVVPSDRHIDFIKVDVEGGELDVFRGANNLLQRCQPHILFECTHSGLTSFGFTPNEIFNFLTQQHAYSVFLIKDWLDSKEPLNFEKFSHTMQYPFQAFNFIATK
ncbi:MAG: FkbM family methyltransferase [Candidatus Parabeggiatoa sp. nov. 3]|nr:MAG: FkbM family methyltransferase [Gammaproteobacteria bacterium]RKZ67294.1 MAG: FkbM family methyltransferase [Gammaproteobacteria bacterium]RKZ72938.1 MAG: FkbM family methyltransferase [Gammaproteobacteria bacterium]HEW98720.1 FkbM family methyltransferase [Beggiatoa sp.]